MCASCAQRYKSLHTKRFVLVNFGSSGNLPRKTFSLNIPRTNYKRSRMWHSVRKKKKAEADLERSVIRDIKSEDEVGS